MLLQFFLLILLLLIIFFISKSLINQIYSIIQKVFRNQKIAVWILAILFLPGTVIHELSHLIMALFLRVPTGPMSIFPEFNNESNKSIEVRTGHIMIAKTDPLRLTIIGVAPMIIGLTLIYFLTDYFWKGWYFVIYLLFITSTTMFSSRQDLKSLLLTLPVTILIVTALFMSGVKISIEGNILGITEKILTNLNRGLILTAGIDYLVLFILACLGWLASLRLTAI